MENLKIKTYSNGVSKLPDYPSDEGYTAEMLKAVFDSRTDKEIKEKFNALIDELVRKFEAAAEETEKAEQNANNFAGTLVASHNTATDSHTDIRAIISELAVRLNTVADSDDVTLDQLSEIISYIKDNREIIEVIMQNKANADDVYDRETVDALLNGKVGEEELKSELEGYVKDTDYATRDKAGVVKVNSRIGQTGLWMSDDGQLSIQEALEGDIDAQIPMTVITSAHVAYAVEIHGKTYFATKEEVGDISSALDELHAYAEALINGGAE